MRSGVSLVLVDTEAHVLANNALAQCLREFAFDEVLVFTDQPALWPQHRTVRIPRIADIEDYNRIVLTDLVEHLRSDHFVIAQYDGFVLDGRAFDEAFRDFDYIGAPWPQFDHFRVGNGGFSWRSRRLAEAVARIAHWRDPGEPEDVFIGRIARVALEARHGLRFADEALAARFSREAVTTGGATFGFHGPMHLPVVYRQALPFLVQHLPQRVIDGRLGLLAWGAKSLDAVQQAQFWALVQQRCHPAPLPTGVAQAA